MTYKNTSVLSLLLAGVLLLAISPSRALAAESTIHSFLPVHSLLTSEIISEPVVDLDLLFPVPERVVPIATLDTRGVSTYFSAKHRGIDIRAPLGSAILSMHEGIVTETAFQKGGYGKYVVIEHTEDGQPVRGLYAHMREVAVSVGDKVETKQVIGSVGLTGHTTGPHVHFEVHVDERAMDPIKYLTKGVPKTLALKK